MGEERNRNGTLASVKPSPSHEPAWYPHALVDRPCDPSTFADGLPSPWGRVHGWDFTSALEPAWWAHQAETAWGDWPTEVTSVEVVGHTRHAVVLDLDSQWTAHLYPFPTGQDVSTLTRYGPWADALSRAPLVMPVGGQIGDQGDRVCVFPHHALLETAEVMTRPLDLARSAGQVHAALVSHATPNTERRWNERLKSMEDGLKSTTLWRASHTKHVVGLPSVHFSLEGVVERPEGLAYVPQPRSLVDHVLADGERLPGVASMAFLEQRLAMLDVFGTTGERQAFYEAWGGEVPSAWTNPASISTVNGGVWIWRYEAMLLMLAEAKAHGLTQQAKRCERWLFDVSRIQARLGELRTVHAVRKGGVYAAIAAAIIGSGPLQLPFVAGSLLVSLVAHGVHAKRVPPPF